MGVSEPSVALVSLELANIERGNTAECREELTAAPNVFEPPPADTGAGAWKFLAGCFLVEALLWGFLLSYGVFQNYYTQMPEFAGQTSNISAVGTVGTSIYFIAAPFASPLMKRYQRWQRHMLATGWAVCAASLLVASFTSSVQGIIATQGVMYGIGFLLLYFPVIMMLNDWFVQRRGFAFSFLYAGGGVSGAGLPFLLEWLLSSAGYRTTLRIVAAVQFAALVPGMMLLKPRLPPSRDAALRRVDLKFFGKPLFWFFMLSNIFQGLGYYIPSLYLPTFATAIGLSRSIGALLLAVNNLATVVGQLGFGYLSDRYANIHVLVFVTTFVSAVAAFCLWGLATSLAPLLIFAFLYGSFAGAYVVFWSAFGSLLSEDPQPVYSLMAFGKGIGNILTAPISAALLSRPMTSGYGKGTFGPLIIFLGTCMFLSSLQITWLSFRRLPKFST
ncbi:hypothetical protein VHEMI07627 [[Torrubiella] hemipterigena]|uniref:Major facilitator superfamily (MFS) profile domain-containing protein n=1 Tax=[Torrubiella] hemipterigena TaxID=1531966 RepID=A0A0A1T430_9HYPO|nr:hypothetical protein VHEMI07627 [[Torrubiella] hemipterigena]